MNFPKTLYMASSIEDIKARYPLPVYNFKVEINGKTIAFSKISGISKSFNAYVYKESRRLNRAAGLKSCTCGPRSGLSI